MAFNPGQGIISPGQAVKDVVERKTKGRPSAFTPVKDPSGRVVYNSPFTGGGSSGGSRGGGGGGSSGSSGGGGPSGADLARAAAEAERKRQAELARQAELKRQQEEASKLREQVQKAKQDKAQSQTIAGQITPTTSGPQPLTVSKYNPEERYTTTPYKRSFVQSTKAALGGLFADIGAGNLGSPGKYIDEYKYSEGLKRDVVAYVNPVFGTTITDPVTGKPQTGEVTFGDIQRKVETKREKDILATSNIFETKGKDISSGYQEKVYSGELTVEQATEKATKEFDVLNVGYKKEQEKIYKKSPDVPGVFERTGTTRKVVGIVPDVLATGASVGVGLVNPVAGASIGLAYFGGKGILQATQKPTYKEVGQQGGLFAGVTADESGRLSITEPTQLDVTYTGLRKEAGVNLLIGAAYGGGLGAAYQKSYYTQALKDVGESPFVAKSVSYAKDKSSFDIIKGVQKSGQIERQITISGKVIKQGDKTFIMPSGQGYSTTTGKFAWGSKGVDPVYYAGGDVFKVGTKGASFQLGKGYATFGKGVVEPQLSFGGIFKSSTDDIGKAIGSNIKTGGKADIGLFTGYSEKLGVDKAGAEYYKSIGGKVNVLGTEGSGFRAFSFKAPEKVGTFGVQKVVKVGASSVDDVSSLGGESLFSFGRGTGTKIVKGYGSPAIQSSLLEQSSKSVSAGQIKAITTPSLTSSISKSFVSVAPPSIVQMGGTARSKYFGVGGGQIYDTEIYGGNILEGMKGYSMLETKPIDSSFVFQSSSVLPGVKSRGRTGIGVTSIPKPGMSLSSSLISGQTLIPKQLTGQKIRQRTIQEQILIQQPIVQPPLLSPGFGQGFDFGLPPFGFIKPKMAQFGKSTGKVQRSKQRTAFQTSFTGSILKIRGTGLAPGGLSLRGLLSDKEGKKIKYNSIF